MRLPATQLYHVTGSGIEGGASRALVFLNFPVALMAIAVLLALLDRLETPAERGLALVATGLCLAIFFGVVDQANLDARPVNAIAAVGVALAFGLTLRAAGRRLFGQKKSRENHHYSCTTTGILSPGFSLGRPCVVTTTFPHSPEGGNPPI